MNQEGFLLMNQGEMVQMSFVVEGELSNWCKSNRQAERESFSLNLISS